MITRGDRRHGTQAGYLAGCHDVCCRTAWARGVAEYRKRRYLNRGPLRRPVIGSARRLRALTAAGWGTAYLADRLGDRIGHIREWRAERYPTVLAETDQRIRDLYAELADRTPPPSRAGTHARLHAERMGWPLPICWDDDTIDDPDAEPWAEEPRIVVPPEIRNAGGSSQARNGRIGAYVRKQAAAARRAALIEDVEFLLANGVHATMITTRLGTSACALDRQLRLAGRSGSHDRPHPRARAPRVTPGWCPAHPRGPAHPLRLARAPQRQTGVWSTHPGPVGAPPRRPRTAPPAPRDGRPVLVPALHRDPHQLGLHRTARSERSRCCRCTRPPG
jgi:hypothetical protein